MNYKKKFKGELAVNESSTALNIMSRLFGIVAFAIGIVNTCWGNDPGFGIFIILLSFLYILPINAILRKMTGFFIPFIGIVKIFLGIFILWAAVGVGESFDKVELMMNSI